jgi:hypothetical protein
MIAIRVLVGVIFVLGLYNNSNQVLFFGIDELVIPKTFRAVSNSCRRKRIRAVRANYKSIISKCRSD